MRRLSTGFWRVLPVAAALAFTALPAGAQPEDRQDPGVVDVIEVSGRLDPILVDFVEQAVARAEDDAAVALVLQLNSPGAAVGDDEMRRLVERLATADVPVAVWVGPSGSAARGAAAELVGVSDDSAMASGTHIGDLDDPVTPPEAFRPDFRAELDRLADQSLDEDEAVDAEVVERFAPTIGDFTIDLEGVVTEAEERAGQPRRVPVTETRFRALPLVSQLFHTVASPPVAYLLLVVGMALILFELYTAGVGIAGVAGAGLLALGGYGLAVLPASWFGVALLVFAVLAFAVDVQTGVPRVWTGIGLVAYVAGTLTLYEGITLSWITLASSFAGVLLFTLAGMPAMVRTRFSTPTIGRQWMVGEEGRARGEIHPEGAVAVRGALWRARTHRATPIPSGATVRVVAIEGVVLEVEPLDEEDE